MYVGTAWRLSAGRHKSTAIGVTDNSAPHHGGSATTLATVTSAGTRSAIAIGGIRVPGSSIDIGGPARDMNRAITTVSATLDQLACVSFGTRQQQNRDRNAGNWKRIIDVHRC